MTRDEALDLSDELVALAFEHSIQVKVEAIIPPETGERVSPLELEQVGDYRIVVHPRNDAALSTHRWEQLVMLSQKFGVTFDAEVYSITF